MSNSASVRDTSNAQEGEVAAMFVFVDRVLQTGFGSVGRKHLTDAVEAYLKCVDVNRVYADSMFGATKRKDNWPRFFVETLSREPDASGRPLEESFYGEPGVVISPQLSLILASHKRAKKLVFAFLGDAPTWDNLYEPLAVALDESDERGRSRVMHIATRISLAKAVPELPEADGWKFVVAEII